MASLGQDLRKWWLPERSPLSIDRFRIAAGAGLVVHFATRFWETSSVFEWCGPADLRFLAVDRRVVPVEWFGRGLTREALFWAFGAGALLSLGITLGVAPRWLSALAWALSVAVYRAIHPIAGPDDYLANATLLSLWLMPTGHALSASTRRKQAAQNGERVSGLAATVLLVGGSLFYLSLGGGLDVFPVEASSGLVVRMLPLAFVLPVPGLAVLGVALQLGVHGYGIVGTSSPLTHWVLASTALLFWGELEVPGRRRHIFDAGGMAAATGGVLLLLCVLGVAVFGAVPRSVARFVSDGGLLPPAAPEEGRGSGASLSVMVSDLGTDGTRAVRFPGRGRLAQRFVAALGKAPANGGRLDLARSLSTGYCASLGYLGQRGTLLWEAGEERRPLAEFECGLGGTLVEIH